MKKIRKKLARIETLVEGWSLSGGADEMERDLALDILRDIYSEIRFCDPVKSGKKKEEPAVSVLREVLEEAVAIAPIGSETGNGNEAEAGNGNGSENEAGNESETEAGNGSAALSGGKVGDPERECRPLHLAAHLDLGERETETKSESAPEPVAPEPRIVPRRVAPEVIRSLYGGKGSAIKQPEKREPEPEKAPEPAPGKARESKHAHTPTIGDAAIREGRQTIGERLRSAEKDVASTLAAAEHTDLKRSIGLNDRFLMIRDMFYGDENAFDGAIERLDAFTDLDDAIIYIHDTYDWNADDEGVRMLVELLERKLG